VATPGQVERPARPAAGFLRGRALPRHLRPGAVQHADRAATRCVHCGLFGGGLGGCPYAESATGNLATEDLVWMLDGLASRPVSTSTSWRTPARGWPRSWTGRARPAWCGRCEVDVRVGELTSDTWPALEKLFGPNGADGGCWCNVSFRLPGPEWKRDMTSSRRRAVGAEELLHAGQVSEVSSPTRTSTSQRPHHAGRARPVQLLAIHALVSASLSRSTTGRDARPSSIQTRSSVARLPVADSAYGQPPRPPAKSPQWTHRVAARSACWTAPGRRCRGSARPRRKPAAGRAAARPDLRGHADRVPSDSCEQPMSRSLLRPRPPALGRPAPSHGSPKHIDTYPRTSRPSARARVTTGSNMRLRVERAVEVAVGERLGGAREDRDVPHPGGQRAVQTALVGHQHGYETRRGAPARRAAPRRRQAVEPSPGARKLVASSTVSPASANRSRNSILTSTGRSGPRSAARRGRRPPRSSPASATRSRPRWPASPSSRADTYRRRPRWSPGGGPAARCTAGSAAGRPAASSRRRGCRSPRGR